MGLGKEQDEEEDAFEREKEVVAMSESRAAGSREKRVRKRCQVDSEKMYLLQNTTTSSTPGFWEIIVEVFPAIPYKPLLFLGLFTCIASGAMTPISSFLHSRLLFEVSTGAHNVSAINLSALDGLLMGLKYFLMETAGNAWVLRIRRQGSPTS